MSTPITSDFPSLTKTLGDAPFKLATPASSDTTPFTYTSDSRAVATITGSLVTLAGAGTAKITATQLKDSFPITLRTAILTVLPSPGTVGGVGVPTPTPTVTTLSLNVNNSTPLPAFGTRAVSAVVSTNGVAASTTPTAVSFTASCGILSPASITSDGAGVASTTYSANAAAADGCAGRQVTITAAATGATAVSGSFTVQPALVANLQFIGATPSLLYLAGSGGATLAQLTFRVVDSAGTALANQAVKLTLTNQTSSVSLGSVSNKSPVTMNTGSDGQVTVPVFSGAIPTSVQINAALVARPDINVNSKALVIASGVPVQKSASLALDKFSIEGMTTDGVSSNVSFSIADRQGNPVPVGTTVNFVSSHGVMVPATCVVPMLADGTSASSCTASIRAQGARPPSGKVVILAYTTGEEDFVDLNGNNVYDAGEPFTDLGNVYRDDDFSLTFGAGEFTVPRAPANGSAGVACPAATNGVLGRDGTCDGIWGAIEVRDQRTVIFASGSAVFLQTSSSLATGPGFVIADILGNSLPTGTKIAVTARAAAAEGKCTTVPSTAVVPNTIGPIAVGIRTDKCVAGDSADISITSPLGMVTTRTLTFTP